MYELIKCCKILKFPAGGGVQKVAPKIQFGHRFNEIISVDNLLSAWKEFADGKSKKRDVQEFGLRLMDNILALHDDLAHYTYTHGSYTMFRIADPKPRLIHKATVRDRVLHHAIYRILYPFFDRTFIADSFSCRIGKGTHRAMNRFRTFAYRASYKHTRTCWVLHCDVKKCFASIDQRVLLAILQQYITDDDTLWLLQQVIESFSSGTPHIGLPLGNLTSQLFANIYLNVLDQFAKHHLHARYYLRYSDDFIVLSDDRAWLSDLIPKLRSFLADQLRLELHPKKITLKSLASGVDILGWVHFVDHRVLRTATKRRMFRRIREHPTKGTIQSYKGLLSHGNARHLVRSIDACDATCDEW